MHGSFSVNFHLWLEKFKCEVLTDVIHTVNFDKLSFAGNFILET